MKYTIRLSAIRAVVYSFFLVAAVAILGACGMPFDWSLNMPDDWGMTSDPDGLGGDDGFGFTGGNDPVDPPAGPLAIMVSGDNFTLEWDGSAAPVSEYRLYHRARGSGEWIPTASGLDAPEATITTADLAHGQYEFAVSTVSLGGTESELHTSLDASADPGTGWYLDWTQA